MNTYHNPNITKYLTNEMTEQEKKEFEKEMKSNPELARAVEDLKPMLQVLKTELENESLPLAHVDTEISLGDKLRKFFYVLTPVAAVATVAFIIIKPNEELESYKNKISPAAPEIAKQNSVTPKEEQKSRRSDRAQSLAKKVNHNNFAGVAESSMDMRAAPAGTGGIGVAPSTFMPHPTPGIPVFKSNSEEYDQITANEFIKVMSEPLSTFSIDVDTASYSNIRRFLNRGQLPPKDAVRIEEMINYFSYDYAAPKKDKPFSVQMDFTTSPWSKETKLLRVGLKGREINWQERKASNLVFLLDVSGSMNNFNKLPLVKQGLKLMIDILDEKDRVSIVVYAGASGLVLPATKGSDKEEILAALERLSSGGGTNGGAGIELAYAEAQRNFIKDGINRVILATDGDFNVGTQSRAALDELIQEKAKSDVFLTVLGFGSGNLKDSQMESLANKGNGHYAYIDSYKEAKKVLVEQIGGTMMTIAKDVKIQVEFNPGKVDAYRLIGYENRLLAKEDFNDDTKDAGEIGAGHTVTALYEIVPKGGKIPTPKIDDLKYQKTETHTDKEIQLNESDEWLTVKLRYKAPDSDRSQKIEFPLAVKPSIFSQADKDTQFAAAVASFGMLLRESKFSKELKFEDIIKMAREAKGEDEKGYRTEFIELVEKAQKAKNPQ